MSGRDPWLFFYLKGIMLLGMLGSNRRVNSQRAWRAEDQMASGGTKAERWIILSTAVVLARMHGQTDHARWT